MARSLYTSQNCIDEVRSLLDEADRESIDDTADILPALNRGLVHAWSILSRSYPDPIIQYTTLATSSGVSEYELPEGLFEDRIMKVEAIGAGGRYDPIQRASFRDITLYEESTQVPVPSYYVVVGRTMRLVPPPSGVYDLRIWYVREAEPLTLPQGRITSINTASNYVILDGIGDQLTTETDQLASYVNIVDGQTGLIKGSVQIQTINGNRVSFRGSPLRSQVVNRTILPSISAITQLAVDDYLSPIEGSCVPFPFQPVTNFCIEFAVAELTRKLGGNASQEEQILQKFEQQVSRTWVGRERQMRVQRKLSAWGLNNRRTWFTNG